MVIPFVIITFAICVLIDWLLGRKDPEPAAEPGCDSYGPALIDLGKSRRIAGFWINDRLRYHPGHTWTRVESDTLITLGIDDVAAALIGRVMTIEPASDPDLVVGAEWITFVTRFLHIGLTSPVNGRIERLNPDILRAPGLITGDPYGAGWLASVQVSNAATALRNTIPEQLLEDWFEKDSDVIGKALGPAPWISSGDRVRLDHRVALLETVLLVRPVPLSDREASELTERPGGGNRVPDTNRTALLHHRRRRSGRSRRDGVAAPPDARNPS